MTSIFPEIGIMVPHVLLPKKDIDIKKWAVVACDQYTSQPDYWEKVKEIVGQDPSTLNIVYPEVYLEEENKKERIHNIQTTMKEYLEQQILEDQGECFVAIERSTSHTTSRKGLVIALDLEAYEYTVGSQTLIRATEGTVVDRLPPRIQIRKEASIESPHIMVLIDDEGKTVIEPIFENIKKYQKLYESDLMMNGGHIVGYKISEKEDIIKITTALTALSNKELCKQKYNVGDEKGVLLFAMGDGNHSLATAKAIWEEKKTTLTEEEKKEHPSRFALVEIVNVHDTGLTFEPIHRVVFNINPKKLLEDMKLFFEKEGTNMSLEIFGNKEEYQLNKKESNSSVQYIKVIFDKIYGQIGLQNPKFNLEVGNLQAFLDTYLKEYSEAKIDYVHGENITEKLGSQANNIGFLLPIMHKTELFKTVIIDGVLPRKTFSMGEAEEKRFYIECRKITK